MDYAGIVNTLLEKFPKRALLAAIVATGLVVLYSASVGLELALKPLHECRLWIWVGTIFALCLLVALLVGDLWGIGHAMWIERKRRQRVTHRLEHLESDELELLAKLALRDERAVSEDLATGRGYGLSGAGYRLCEAGIMRRSPLIREFQVDEWACGYLQKHRDLVIAPEEDPLARQR